MQTSTVPRCDPHSHSWPLGEKQRSQAQAVHQRRQAYSPIHSNQTTSSPRWTLLRPHMWQAVLFKSYTQTGQAAFSHMPGVTSQISSKKQPILSFLVSLPQSEKCCSNCNSVSFGGKLNDIRDPVILTEKSERKIIRTIRCKPKESSLSRGFVF